MRGHASHMQAVHAPEVTTINCLRVSSRPTLRQSESLHVSPRSVLSHSSGTQPQSYHNCRCNSLGQPAVPAFRSISTFLGRACSVPQACLIVLRTPHSLLLAAAIDEVGSEHSNVIPSQSGKISRSNILIQSSCARTWKWWFAVPE